jgi:hypothetical protein
MLALAVLLAMVPIEGPGYVSPAPELPVRVVTTYHATVEECDDSPLTTADGTTWKATSIANRRIAAVSQDLLWRNGGPVRFGDWLWVDVPDGQLAGLWRVHDTMWAGVQGYVDLLVPAGHNACWRHEDVVVRHPEWCPVGARVYHLLRGGDDD